MGFCLQFQVYLREGHTIFMLYYCVLIKHKNCNDVNSTRMRWSQKTQQTHYTSRYKPLTQSPAKDLKTSSEFATTYLHPTLSILTVRVVCGSGFSTGVNRASVLVCFTFNGELEGVVGESFSSPFAGRVFTQHGLQMQRVLPKLSEILWK